MLFHTHHKTNYQWLTYLKMLQASSSVNNATASFKKTIQQLAELVLLLIILFKGHKSGTNSRSSTEWTVYRQVR